MDEPVFVPKDGKPTLEIDFDKLDKLLHIQCTLEECAAILDCSTDTLKRRVEYNKNMTFARYAEEKKAGGKMSLRRKQWTKAIRHGDNTMLIWLGKQYLDQTDKAYEKRDVNVAVTVDYDKQRAEFKELVEQQARKLLDGGYVPALPGHTETI